jgi:hypothetical protein
MRSVKDMLGIVRRLVGEGGGAFQIRRRRRKTQGLSPRGWERTHMLDSDIDRKDEPEFVPGETYGFYE